VISAAVRYRDHDVLCRLARTSEFTRDFSSIMFSHEGAYKKGWIRIYQNDRGEVLGFTCVRHKIQQPKTVLYFLTVAPSERGKLIGTALMRDLELQTPHPTIHFNVSHKNPNARRFYERLGYTLVREDAISGTAWELQKSVPRKVA